MNVFGGIFPENHIPFRMLFRCAPDRLCPDAGKKLLRNLSGCGQGAHRFRNKIFRRVFGFFTLRLQFLTPSPLAFSIRIRLFFRLCFHAVSSELLREHFLRDVTKKARLFSRRPATRPVGFRDGATEDDKPEPGPLRPVSGAFFQDVSIRSAARQTRCGAVGLLTRSGDGGTFPFRPSGKQRAPEPVPGLCRARSGPCGRKRVIFAGPPRHCRAGRPVARDRGQCGGCLPWNRRFFRPARALLPGPG